MSKTTRLLLPFTHGIEMETLEAAVMLAASHQATLVPLSLIPSSQSSQARGKGARLEHIQQSKDFLEATQQKALRHGITLERFEVFTDNVTQSIAALVEQMACDGVILALRGRQGSLLNAEMIERLMAMRPCPLFLIYLPSRESSWVAQLRERFSNWWPGQRQRTKSYTQQPTVQEEQTSQEVVLSGYAGSPDATNE